MFRNLIVVFTTVSCWSAGALTAQPTAEDITNITVNRLPDEFFVPMAVESDCSTMNLNALEDVVPGWSEVIAIGEKVWKLVQDNKPVVNLKTPTVHVLPRGVSCWADLEKWQAPKTESYEVVYSNILGLDVVSFRFRLQYAYGGGRDGKGQYLSNVTVMPAHVSVLPGYNFNAEVEPGNAVNLGTHDAPVAGLEMNVKWSVKTLLKETHESFHFFVQGDGSAKSTN